MRVLVSINFYSKDDLRLIIGEIKNTKIRKYIDYNNWQLTLFQEK